MGSRRDRKLKNYLINKDFQLRIAFTNLIYMSVVIIMTLGVIMSPLLHDMFFSEDVSIQYQAAQTFLALVKRLIPALMAMFILIFVHQVVVTHRICGPIVNFTNTFIRVADGDLSRKVFLRQGDYLRKECDKVNHMIDALAGLITRIRADHGKLISALEEIMASVEDLDTKKKVEDALEIVKREAQFVSEDLSLFKIENSHRTSDAADGPHNKNS